MCPFRGERSVGGAELPPLSRGVCSPPGTLLILSETAGLGTPSCQSPQRLRRWPDSCFPVTIPRSHQRREHTNVFGCSFPRWGLCVQGTQPSLEGGRVDHNGSGNLRTPVDETLLQASSLIDETQRGVTATGPKEVRYPAQRPPIPNPGRTRKRRSSNTCGEGCSDLDVKREIDSVRRRLRAAGSPWCPGS